jgi:anti-sigma factor RsiW
MTRSDANRHDLACRDFVELVTAYLDHALPDSTRAEIDEHLELCHGCRTVLAQWHTVIELTGRLTPAAIEHADPLTRDRLMSALHGIRRR